MWGGEEIQEHNGRQEWGERATGQIQPLLLFIVNSMLEAIHCTTKFTTGCGKTQVERHKL